MDVLGWCGTQALDTRYLSELGHGGRLLHTLFKKETCRRVQHSNVFGSRRYMQSAPQANEAKERL